MDDLFDEETGQNSTENQEVYVYSQTKEQGDKGGGLVRDERGRWVKGHGPPPELPPARVGELLEQALTWAQEYKSPKLVLAILQFHYSYTLGMPVQRSVTASTKLETLLNRIGEMDEAEFAQVEQQMRSE